MSSPSEIDEMSESQVQKQKKEKLEQESILKELAKV
jgi:hypothetical protein